MHLTPYTLYLDKQTSAYDTSKRRRLSRWILLWIVISCVFSLGTVLTTIGFKQPVMKLRNEAVCIVEEPRLSKDCTSDCVAKVSLMVNNSTTFNLTTIDRFDMDSVHSHYLPGDVVPCYYDIDANNRYWVSYEAMTFRFTYTKMLIGFGIASVVASLLLVAYFVVFEITILPSLSLQTIKTKIRKFAKQKRPRVKKSYKKDGEHVLMSENEIELPDYVALYYQEN